MAMVVQHNIAAQLALGELNKNSDRLRKSLAKVSSGQKINSAQDDASSYVISEKMREQIRSLAQDNQNVQNGSSLFKIADGGINSIVEELRNLKELAVNSANDTNTDVDRLTIQKEFKQKMANINDIATTTNYNGKTLLDGTWGRRMSQSSAGNTYIEPMPTFASVFKEVSEPSGATTTISGTSYTISSDGVYEIAAGFTGTITVNAQNVKIKQANPSTTLNEVLIVGPSGGNANLWIEDLNIATSTWTGSMISFSGENNVLTVRGNNILKGTANSGGYGGGAAAIFTGSSPYGSSTNYTALNVQGDSGSTLSITMSGVQHGAGIGYSGSSGYTGAINIINLNLTAAVEAAAVVGTGDGASHVGDITVENSKIEHNGTGSGLGTAVGVHGNGASAGDILVVSSEITSTNTALAIGATDHGKTASTPGSTCGTITVHDSKVTTSAPSSGLAMGIGILDNEGSCGDIFVSASVIDINSYMCPGIDSIMTSSANLPNITITHGTQITHVSTRGAAVGTGGSTYENYFVGDITISRSSYDLLDASQAYQDENQPYPGLGNGLNGTAGTVTIVEDLTEEILSTAQGKPLKIHHGTKANQATNFFIEDMHTRSLGTEKLLDDYGLPLSESDLARYDALSYDDDLQAAWLETLKSAQNKTLDDISVTTQKNSNVAIRVIDGAIEYALNEATKVGSYLQRLDYTDANVTTMGENVQAAESTIRDADMAKEMTDYTKNNVLLQASQAMLAQANQNGSAVLSLLQ